MKVCDCADLLNAEILVKTESFEEDLKIACGSDLMSDVMAFSSDDSQIMITGLVNPQTIRTAEMLDVKVIIFVRGKVPDETMQELARDKGIGLMTSPLSMFTCCGLLYEAGLRGKEAAV
ncbi:MAG: hypothetical protein J6T40_00920 [Clostridiales bacterium]|nr:hypothetical protein [Clostridiales bacterium]MBR5937696.1 hypothetical protein [Clostridiales bacterium]